MEGGEIPDQYFTFEGRLASFQSAQPVSRRKSNAKGRAPKPLAWPHKQLDPTAVCSYVPCASYGCEIWLQLTDFDAHSLLEPVSTSNLHQNCPTMRSVSYAKNESAGGRMETIRSKSTYDYLGIVAGLSSQPSSRDLVTTVLTTPAFLP
jgi:hypothetical protein